MRRIAVAKAARATGAPVRALHIGADIWGTNAPGHIESYYSRTHQRAGRVGSPATALRSGQTEEVVIIGGGLAGVNTALSLAHRGVNPLLLEANTLAWAASGRNGGFVHPGFSLDMGTLSSMVGKSHARTLWWLTHAALSTVRDRVTRWSPTPEAASSTARSDPLLGGGPMLPGMLTASWFNDAAGVKAGIEAENELLGADYLQFWDRSRVQSTYATAKYYDGTYDPDSFHFHSMNYVAAAAAEAKALGASIVEGRGARVLRVDDPAAAPGSAASAATGGSAGLHRILTEDGTVIHARHVIVCGSAYMPKLAGPSVAPIVRAVLPIMTYACVTEPLGPERLAKVMAAPHAVTDNRFACDYYRPLADTRILWGGRIDVLGIDPSKLASVLHADMCKVYPQLADVKVEMAWPGVMGYARHKMPLIGKVGPAVKGAGGVWYATGFGGHGLCPTAMAGELLASAIAEGNDAYKLFKPFGLEWAGGPIAGAAAAQAFYWAYEARDWLKERRVNKQ